MGKLRIELEKEKGIEPLHTDLINNAKNYQMERVMTQLPNNYGVENFVKLLRAGGTAFDGIHEALMDDGKVSLTEGIQLGVSLFPQILGLISGITQIPQEVIYDMVSEQDFEQISAAFDGIQHLKGDTRDAVRGLLKILLSLKDWYFEFFVDEQPPIQP